MNKNKKWLNQEIERLGTLKENTKPQKVKRIIEEQINQLERENKRREGGFLVG